MAELQDYTNKKNYTGTKTIDEDNRTIIAGPVTLENLTLNGAITVTAILTITANLTVQGTDARVQVI